MNLEGKTILITGAARGIGRATALTMANEGGHVAVADILPEVDKTADLIKKKGRNATAVVFDISDPQSVCKGVESVRSQMGTIDILVNNAGIVANIAPFVKMTYEAWTREIAINLTGTFNMIKETIGPMIEQEWGRIINFSSLAAIGGLQYQCAYAASKAGLLGLTKTIAIEHARDGITCNAILPGLINTEQVRMLPDEKKAGSISLIPSRRFGNMDEVAHLVAFLASEQSSYINGEEISVDGGMKLTQGSLWSPKKTKGVSNI